MSDQDIIDTGVARGVVAKTIKSIAGTNSSDRTFLAYADCILVDLEVAGYEVVRREVDGYCTCHPDQRYKTADCGMVAHRAAAEKAEGK